MLSIKVLGPGCAKCNLLEQHAVEALEKLAEEIPSLEATIQHVSDYDEISKYPVLTTPALVINERVVSSGHVPSVNKVIGWLREATNPMQ